MNKIEEFLGLKSGELTSMLIDVGTKILIAVVVLILGIWLAKILSRGLKRVLEKRNTDPSLTIFLSSLISILLKTLVVVTAITQLGVEMTSLDAIALFVGIVCWAQFGIRFHLSCSKQRERERGEANTLLEEIDRDIEKVNFEINGRDLPSLIKGYIPPHLGGMLFVWVIFRASGVPGWAFVPFVAVMITGFVCHPLSRCSGIRPSFLYRHLGQA